MVLTVTKILRENGVHSFSKMAANIGVPWLQQVLYSQRLPYTTEKNCPSQTFVSNVRLLFNSPY